MSLMTSIMNQIAAAPVLTWVYINSYQSDPNPDLYVIDSTSGGPEDSIIELEAVYPAEDWSVGVTAAVYNGIMEYDLFEVQLV